MEGIEKTVLKLIGSQTEKNGYNLFKMKACWSEIVGKNNAKHCGPAKLERRILTLQVDSSVWSNQFLYFKNQFIEKINSFMGVDYVKDIKFVLSKEFKNKIHYHVKTEKDSNKILIPELSEQEKKALFVKFSYIKNEKVRDAVIKAEEKRFGLEKLYEEGKIKKCPVCGQYLKNGELSCYLCEKEKQEKKEGNIRKKIKKEPWIQWHDMNKIIPCEETEFNMILNDIRSYYFEKLRLKTASESEEKLAVQLKTGKPFALISEKEYENVLKFLQKGK